MPRFILLLAALLFAFPSGRAQTLDLVATATFPIDPAFGTGGSDVWGYTAPDGSEYALFGIWEGLAVVAVPSMQTVGIIPGPQDADFYYHRDMVVHGDYAYIVSENYGTNEGLQVVDLSDLPGSVTLVNTLGGNLLSSHNLDVDGETGYLYVLNSSASAVLILDTANPAQPAQVNSIPVGLHDVHARGDTLYVAEGSSGSFSIWDVSDRMSPALMARVPIPNPGYVHNIWPTDDGRYVLTTEETSNKTVKVWDISDMSNIQLVGEYLGPNNLAHNVHIQGDYAFLSHYESGMIVLDISDPTQPLEIARYDTYRGGENPQFNGNWGMTVPSPNGYVYGGDFDGTLTVLRFSPSTVATESASTPTQTVLDPVSPNPAPDGSTVRFRLDTPAAVRVTIVDALGREVARLAEGTHRAGEHMLPIESNDLPSGLYIVRLDVEGRTHTRRFTVLR